MNSNLVYLVQTDTTVGFSSSNDEKLFTVKQRDKSQKILQTITSFNYLKKQTRIPIKFRKMIRNSKKSTYIYPNGLSFRIVDNKSIYYAFVSKFNFMYSTSANLTKKNYDYEFAKQHSDILLLTKESYREFSPSSIYKVYKTKCERIR